MSSKFFKDNKCYKAGTDNQDLICDKYLLNNQDMSFGHTRNMDIITNQPYSDQNLVQSHADNFENPKYCGDPKSKTSTTQAHLAQHQRIKTMHSDNTKLSFDDKNLCDRLKQKSNVKFQIGKKYKK